MHMGLLRARTWYGLSVLGGLVGSLCAASGCECTRGPAPKVASGAAQRSKETTHSAPQATAGEHTGFNPHSGHDPAHTHNHEVEQREAPLDDHHVFAGGLTWKAPTGFLRHPPKNEMRAAEYVVQGDRDERAELTVYFFGADQGGSTQNNIDRWVAQFSPQGREVRRFTRTIHALQATGVEIHGTYLGMAMPGEPPPAKAPNHTMIAVVVAGPEGPVFFKWTGPAALIKRHRPQLDELLDSVRPIAP